jgi:cyclopropane fatty-acyl-phospholipid synthase-like methyltransferase
VFELLKTIRVVGLPQILKFFRAYRLGWSGIISGFYSTRVLQTLFDVGLFDELLEKGWVDTEAFSEAGNLDGAILASLCEYLHALDLLEKRGSRYSLTRKGTSIATSARGWFDAVYGYESVFHSLEQLLRKEKRYGKDVFRREEHVIRGSERVEDLIHFPLAIEKIEREGYKRVLDMGCGEGTFLTRLCKSNPEVNGFGFDMNRDAIDRGRAAVLGAGLGDRIHLSVQDFTRLEKAEDMPQDVDVLTFFLILHEMLHRGADGVVDLLKNVKSAFPGVPLLIFEVIRPSLEQMRKRPGMSVQYALHHDLTHQKLVPMKEWEDLFQQAGFRITDASCLDFVKTAIFLIE